MLAALDKVKQALGVKTSESKEEIRQWSTSSADDACYARFLQAMMEKRDKPILPLPVDRCVCESTGSASIYWPLSLRRAARALYNPAVRDAVAAQPIGRGLSPSKDQLQATAFFGSRGSPLQAMVSEASIAPSRLSESAAAICYGTELRERATAFVDAKFSGEAEDTIGLVTVCGADYEFDAELLARKPGGASPARWTPLAADLPFPVCRASVAPSMAALQFDCSWSAADDRFNFSRLLEARSHGLLGQVLHGGGPAGKTTKKKKYRYLEWMLPSDLSFVDERYRVDAAAVRDLLRYRFRRGTSSTEAPPMRLFSDLYVAGIRLILAGFGFDAQTREFASAANWNGSQRQLQALLRSISMFLLSSTRELQSDAPNWQVLQHLKLLKTAVDCLVFVSAYVGFLPEALLRSRQELLDVANLALREGAGKFNQLYDRRDRNLNAEAALAGREESARSDRVPNDVLPDSYRDDERHFSRSIVDVNDLFKL